MEAVADDKDIDDDGNKIDYRPPNDVCGTIHLQINIPEIEENLILRNQKQPPKVIYKPVA